MRYQTDHFPDLIEQLQRERALQVLHVNMLGKAVDGDGLEERRTQARALVAHFDAVIDYFSACLNNRE